MMQTSAAELVPPMPLPQLLDLAETQFADTLVRGMQLDSRSVEPGDVFLAMPGDVHDGRQFIEQAVANGASAILAEAPAAGFVDALPVPLIEIPELRLEVGALAARFFRHPSRELHMVGFTGTNGKTSCSRILAQVLRGLGKSCGVIGTLGNALDNSVTDATNTTPDAVSLQRLLAQWRSEGVIAVSMEVSSHALLQGRVHGVEFDTAVFTNLSRDHLDYHADMEAYGRAKLQLFTMPGLQHVVLNADDPFSAKIHAAVAEDVQVIRYTLDDAEAEVAVTQPQWHATGVTALWRSPWGSASIDSPLPGRFNLANVAAVLAALLAAGEDMHAALEALRKVLPVDGRMQSLGSGEDVQVVVDYAHTPDALEQALRALRVHVVGKLVVVFGCGGERDTGKRQLMGRVASDWADAVIVTSDNPRSEDPQAILSDIASGLRGDYVLEVDRAQAIARAITEAESGDCVLIAGKGHESYQLIDGERRDFSDAEHAQRALDGRRAS